MPVVRIDTLPVRSREQKSDLIRKVTDAVADSLEIAANHVTVLVREVDPADWAIGGTSFAERPPR